MLSPATARALGYDVAEDEAAVKVSGRKGLGVKADDLVDALVAKAKQEIEARDPERSARGQGRRPRAPSRWAPCATSCSSSRRTRIITFDMEEALAFVGETGPYIQNAVVRARNILAKVEAEGHAVGALVERARGLDLARAPGRRGRATRSGRCSCSWPAPTRWPSRRCASQEVALLAKHAFAVAQAFHSYYQKPSYSVLYAETDDLRAFRTLVVDAFLRGMEVLTGLLGIPIPERM